MRIHDTRRPAFTLIEMLVVIGIILLLTALVAMAIPSAGDRNMQQAADKLSGALLIAKQRAKRDGLPTGLRIDIDPTTSQATTVTYIQQPDDYTLAGVTCVATPTPAANPTVCDIAFTNGRNPQGQTTNINLNTAGVQPGDWIELYRGGGVYMIQTVRNARTLRLATNSSRNWPDSKGVATSEWRIFRQPSPVVGEEPLELPDGIVIDDTLHPTTGKPRCSSLPSRVTAGGTFREVVFAPSGGLVGRSSGSDKICVLWLTNTKNGAIGSNLIAIQPHTGLIAVHPEDTGSTDPYSFTRNMRSSGL